MNHWLNRNKKVLPEQSGPPEPHSDYLIDLRQVVKTYTMPGNDLTVLKNIDLRVADNEFVAVVGKSGCGKTTLINMITGIDRPTSGEVIVDGISLHLAGEDQLALWRGRNVGVIFQFFQLLPTLTVMENVMLPMEFCNLLSAKQRSEHALALLESVDLADQAYKLPATLSGGQQQRAAIARALANEPKLLVADEPTGNVDSEASLAILQLFEKLAQEGKTILMVTHDTDLRSRVSRTVRLHDGKLFDQPD